jgi:hypothetical protein
MEQLHADIEISPAVRVETREIDLPATARAPGLARRFIREVTTEWGLYDLPSPVRPLSVFDVIVECVSEIVTNAVVHVSWTTIPHDATPIALRVCLTSNLLAVAVAVDDGDDVLPTIVPLPDPNDKAALLKRENRNGLCIVDSYMAKCRGRFDAHQLPGGGKTVGFELPLTVIARAGS